jgi:predicted DCC family thiol-disulfide oxidoreductase YuxK
MAEQEQVAQTSESTLSTAGRSQPVLLFDGVCNLCNSTVDFILHYDKSQRILFASQQSEAGQALMQRYSVNPTHLSSVILIDQGRVYKRSDAALRTGELMGGFWCELGRIGYVIPKFFRDYIYNWIAQNRYRWFGKRAECRMPSLEERLRFLD